MRAVSIENLQIGKHVYFVDPSGQYSEPLLGPVFSQNQTVIDAFISTATSGIPPLVFKGDNRGFRPSTPSESRLTVWIDNDRKSHAYHVSPSTNTFIGKSYSPSSRNRIDVNFSGSNAFIDIMAVNSGLPGYKNFSAGPAIDNSIMLNNNGMSGFMRGDAYPSYEINQWNGGTMRPMLFSPESGGQYTGAMWNLSPFATDRSVGF